MIGCPSAFTLIDAENLYGLGVVMGSGFVGLAWWLQWVGSRRKPPEPSGHADASNNPPPPPS